MARDVKLEAAAVNLRISDEEKRDYPKLLKRISDIRRGFQVFGDTYIAIRYFDPKGGLGIFVKYTEIDVGGDWFDLEEFEKATPDKLDSIAIPANLRPNHAQFYFILNKNLHVVAFSSYAESKGLSPRAIEKYFKNVFAIPEIVQEFGIIEVDLVQDFEDAMELLERDGIREISIKIRRPNPDDIGDDLAAVMEDRLKEQGAEEYEEDLRTKSGPGISPNDRTKKLALIGAENGSVRVKSPVNGVLKWQDTASSPLTEVVKYKGDESEFVVFEQLAKKLFKKIADVRKSLQNPDPEPGV
jgi:DNA-binding ferritin-like protein (Dps family)